ncbi:MAG TPA: PIN domain-containing protein [Solirubrobacteraceae bacterium]|jgi:PIN domain nuclease of toxin-antitoxin system|nr:PIN domain-containing protein [Solirubrobacteraceae bacterium]
MAKSVATTDEQADPAATLIDASALIALLGAEPAAGEVQEMLSRGAAMTTLNLAEAVDRLKRRYGLEIEQTRPVIEGLLAKSLMLLPLGPAQAWRAGEIRAVYYHRSRCPISLADAVLVASAPAGGRIATSDGHVLTVAASEQVATIALPDSKGRRASAR